MQCQEGVGPTMDDLHSSLFTTTHHTHSPSRPAILVDQTLLIVSETPQPKFLSCVFLGVSSQSVPQVLESRHKSNLFVLVEVRSNRKFLFEDYTDGLFVFLVAWEQKKKNEPVGKTDRNKPQHALRDQCRKSGDFQS